MKSIRSLLMVQKDRAPWVWLITVVTIVYLLVEFGFNSRLLDVVGGMPDKSVVDAIEVYGRCISGFAAALFFWAILLEKGHDRKEDGALTAFKIVLATVIVMFVMYKGELELIDVIVDHSTADSRYVAANLVAVQGALVAKKVVLDDLPLTEEDMTAPDGKTFLAIFPLLAFSVDSLDQKLKSTKPKILRAVADKVYGGLDRNYERFLDSRKAMIDTYNNKYIQASEDYDKPLASIEQKQNSGWESYVARLRKNGLVPDNVPPPYWERVRKDVRNNGVPVAHNWDPGDRGAFNAAVAQRVRSETDSRYRAGIEKALGTTGSVPANLSKDAFFANPSIQKAWSKQLGYDGAGVIMPINLPADSLALAYFRMNVYDKVLDWQQRENMKLYDAPAESFADGQPNAEFGKEKMRALVVPPIALAFSVMGALLHVVKVYLFLVQLVTRWTFRSTAVKFLVIFSVALAGLGSFNFIPTSRITSQPLYQSFEEHDMALGSHYRIGKIMTFYMRSTINAQVVAYPIFEGVRLYVLQGYDFGYKK